ncbi:HAD-IA family hydrolase [Erythrobacter dokdonensis]|jgi:phosphoglycolate phosphatase|uniref:phosphoglycolate phosphatase n=1 Tax=Erythrobacter dokdonensis DSW-74 TaxID=1300349 RepID=A0A1A7BHM3_9SPHN|nr:HAD-IA family hydrolase [Erythrobacter dokdonensis]MEE4316905.1 HAD-IA family hydrolase [Erythrobacter sp.]OBV12053.1 putative phosphatase [Erythrobacter dokdonensis DSW-74]
MTDIPFDAIGFDLDGTLLDTFRDLGAAVNHALVLGGFSEVSIESSKDLIGGGAKIMLARAVEAQGGLPEDEFRRLYKAMLGYYEANNAVHTAPYPGVREVLATLADSGVRMAVVTNKFEAFARNVLTQLDLIDAFETVIGGDSMGKGEDGQFLAKPHPAPVLAAREATGDGLFVFIGDSTYDVRAARGAGVPVVAAAYGYCDRPPHELGADAVIDSFAGLIPALNALGAAN